jgi:hypothetical protein
MPARTHGKHSKVTYEGRAEVDTAALIREVLKVKEEWEKSHPPNPDTSRPGIYPINPPPQRKRCMCSGPFMMVIPANHYYQCECGNRIYGPTYSY